MREITKRQYSGEFKERAREDYLNSDKVYEELSGKCEVNVWILSKWVGIYREHGAQGFEKQPRKTKNTGKMPEILLEIDRTYPLKSSDRKLAEQGRGQILIAAVDGLSKTPLYLQELEKKPVRAGNFLQIQEHPLLAS